MNLSHHFLIAMPSLQDPFFQKSLVYLYRHDEEGCLGAIVNKPVATTLDELVPDVETLFPKKNAKQAIHFGGPVSMEQGVVIHDMPPTEEDPLFNGHVTFSNSLQTLKDVLACTPDPRFLICMGYSGWTAGQLEDELKDNSWLPVEADLDILFHPDPYVKYELALKKLGIDPALMSPTGGNS